MFLQVIYIVINVALTIIYWKSADRNPQNVEKNFKIQKSYDAIMFEINLNENDYSLSEIWEGINAASLNTEFLIENREVKELLIEKNGENVCFTYLRTE